MDGEVSVFSSFWVYWVGGYIDMCLFCVQYKFRNGKQKRNFKSTTEGERTTW